MRAPMGRTRVARALLLAAFLGATGCVSSAWKQLPPETVAGLKAKDPPRSDGKFVPGWRLGPVHLGMSRAELFAALGEPQASLSVDEARAKLLGVLGDPQKSSSLDEATEHHVWKERWLVRTYQGTVVSIQGYPAGERIAEPVAYGASRLAIRTKLGDPTCVNRIATDEDLIYRDIGVLLVVGMHGLRAIYLEAPGELRCPSHG